MRSVTNQPGAMALTADALEGEFEAERAGHLQHAGLGGRVGDDPLGHTEAEDRGDVDDGTGFAGREHAPRALLRAEESRIEVDSEHPPPLRLRQLDGAVRVRDPGIVDQDRDGTERRLDRVIGAVDRGARRFRSLDRDARPPAAVIRAATSESRSRRRATSPTAAPFAASTSAKRAPSPLEAPVTSATRPDRSNSCDAFMCAGIPAQRGAALKYRKSGGGWSCGSASGSRRRSK